MKHITTHDLLILNNIAAVTAARGYAPTQRELARRLGLGISYTHAMICRLRDNGLLEGGGRARTLRILPLEGC